MNKYILIFIMAAFLGCNDKKIEVKKVKVAVVEKDGINNSSLYSGKVLPGNNIQIVSFSSGVVEEVFFKEGDEVKEGDILFKFKGNSIIENEIKLNEVKLELEMVENELKNYDIEKKDTGVKNRALEIKALEYEIKKIKNQLPILKTGIESARKVLEMYKQFLKEESVSIFELEEKKSDLLSKEAEYERLKMKLELDEQKYSIMFLTKDQVEKELQYKEEKLKSKYETLKKDFVIYEKALLESREGVKATKAGILTKFNVNSQSKIERLESVGLLASGEDLIVDIKVPLYQASKIRNGQIANIKFSDFSGTKNYLGEVNRVSNFATDIGNRLGIDVEIQLLDKDIRDLKPGYRVEVEIKTSNNEKYLLVKKFSVIEENGKKYIYILENGKALKKEIETGVQGDSDYEVLNINEGTKIILNPFIVNNGDIVQEVD